jgi:Fe-S cluster assembly protein SufD
MSSALNKYKMIIDNYYNQIANKEEFNFLNTALLLKGSISTYQKQSRWQTCRIMYFSTGWSSAYGAAKELSNCRWKFTCSNYWTPKLNENPVLTNSVTEIFAQKTSYRRLL